MCGPLTGELIEMTYGIATHNVRNERADIWMVQEEEECEMPMRVIMCGKGMSFRTKRKVDRTSMKLYIAVEGSSKEV